MSTKMDELEREVGKISGIPVRMSQVGIDFHAQSAPHLVAKAGDEVILEGIYEPAYPAMWSGYEPGGPAILATGRAEGMDIAPLTSPLEAPARSWVRVIGRALVAASPRFDDCRTLRFQPQATPRVESTTAAIDVVQRLFAVDRRALDGLLAREAGHELPALPERPDIAATLSWDLPTRRFRVSVHASKPLGHAAAVVFVLDHTSTRVEEARVSWIFLGE